MSRKGNGFDDLGHEPPLEPDDDPEMICPRCGGYMDWDDAGVWVCHNPPLEADLADAEFAEGKDGRRECVGMLEPDTDMRDLYDDDPRDRREDF